MVRNGSRKNVDAKLSGSQLIYSANKYGYLKWYCYVIMFSACIVIDAARTKCGGARFM